MPNSLYYSMKEGEKRNVNERKKEEKEKEEKKGYFILFVTFGCGIM
jgi:hypothetical protein